MNMLPQVIEVATEYEKRVTFWSSSSFLQLKTYSRRPLCVPNEPRHAIGTGNTLLVYQTSYIWRLVQETLFWGTNQAISGIWYRG